MLLWRINRHPDLSGEGGLRASGRWYDRGIHVVYLAETPAGALLESCVHTCSNNIPPTYTLLAIAVPDDISIEALYVAIQPPDWVDQPEQTRRAGTEWLRSSVPPCCEPSALVPATFNVILNPLHPDAKGLRIEARYGYPFDPRLKR